MYGEMSEVLKGPLREKGSPDSGSGAVKSGESNRNPAPGVPRSCDRTWRNAPEANCAALRELPSPSEDALGIGQGRAGASLRAASRYGSGDRDPGSRRASPSPREARSVNPVSRWCDLTTPVPQSRCSHTAVPITPGQCCRHILPAHAGSDASLPGVRLDFAPRECRRERRDKPGTRKTGQPVFWRSTVALALGKSCRPHQGEDDQD